MMRLLEQSKEKIKDFIYDLFNPPILPYIYKMSPDVVQSYLLYLLNESVNVYISKGGSYIVAYKISSDCWKEFSEFVSLEEFLKVFDYAGFNYTTYTDIIDSDIIFWVEKNMSIEPADIEKNFLKMLKARDKIELKMQEYGMFFNRLHVNYLLNYVGKISWYNLVSPYSESKPISFCFKSPPLVLRDELFYSPKDIYFTYSVKSTYEDSLITTLESKPFSVDLIKLPIDSDLVITNTFLIKHEDKYKRRICSFILFKITDGMNKFKNSRYYSYDKDNKCIDFSLLEKEVSTEVVSKAHLTRVNFQREQKNLAYFYGVSCLPFNLPFGDDLKYTRRDFSIHAEV